MQTEKDPWLSNRVQDLENALFNKMSNAGYTLSEGFESLHDMGYTDLAEAWSLWTEGD